MNRGKRKQNYLTAKIRTCSLLRQWKATHGSILCFSRVNILDCQHLFFLPYKTGLNLYNFQENYYKDVGNFVFP